MKLSEYFETHTGTLAVKIGQTYALRLDFLPEQNCKHLTQLYRHNDSLAPASFKRLLDSATPKQWQEQFASFDENPLASASVGQVHRGTLKNGNVVVIKRYGVALQSAAVLVHDMRKFIDEFKATMEQQKNQTNRVDA